MDSETEIELQDAVVIIMISVLYYYFVIIEIIYCERKYKPKSIELSS